MTSDLLQRGKNIKLAIFDVDGVLTDGRLYFLDALAANSRRSTPSTAKASRC